MILQKSKIEFDRNIHVDKKHAFLKSDVISVQLQNVAGELKVLSGRIKVEFHNEINNALGINTIEFNDPFIFLVAEEKDCDDNSRIEMARSISPDSSNSSDNWELAALPCPPFCSDGSGSSPGPVMIFPK